MISYDWEFVYAKCFPCQFRGKGEGEGGQGSHVPFLGRLSCGSTQEIPMMRKYIKDTHHRSPNGTSFWCQIKTISSKVKLGELSSPTTN